MLRNHSTGRRRFGFALVCATVCGAASVVPAFDTPPTAYADAVTTVGCVDVLADGPVPAVDLASYEALTPARLVDTRSGHGGHTGVVQAGCTLRLDVSGVPAIPEQAAAVALSVTAVSGEAGFLTVFPCDDGRPATSNLNPRPNVPTPALVVALLDVDRSACIFSDRDAQVIVDLQGWWGTGDNRISSIEPTRVYDTRELEQPGPIPGAAVRNVFVAGVAVPLDATAALVNLTVVGGATNGWATVYPCGVLPPATSNINFLAGEARAVSALVGLGVGGQLCFTTSTAVHFVIDVVGYYAPAPRFGPEVAFAPMSGSRLIDSRDGTGGWTSRLGAGETRQVAPSVVGSAASAAGSDGTLTAVTVNVIGLNASGRGFITLFPCGDGVPTVSTLNTDVGVNATNLATIELDGSGAFCVYSPVETDVVIDLFGVVSVPPGSPLERLALTGARVWPEFDPNAVDYVIDCEDGQTDIGVEIVPFIGDSAVLEVNGAPLPEPFAESTDIAIVGDDLLTVRLTTDDTPSTVVRYNFRCLPSDFPTLVVDRPGEPEPGWYLTSFWANGIGSGPFVAILDERGVPVWYRRAPGNVVNAQRLDDGTISYVVSSVAFGFDPDVAVRVSNLSGSLLGRVFTSDPVALPVDHHEQIRRTDGWTLLSYPLVPGQDLTALGPDFFADDSIVDGVIEEVDDAGDSVWQWSTLDHFSIDEVTFPIRFGNYPAEPNGGEVDVFHINAVDRLDDGSGDYLATARHLDAVFRIDRTSGDVDWILGSLPSDPADPDYVPNASGAPRLAIVDDPRSGVLRPHDARLVGNVLTVHDNRTASGEPARVVAYEIDDLAMTATLLWAVEDPLGRSSGSLGSVRMADDGSRLIGWGALQPMFEEIDVDGDRMMAVTQLPFGFAYRVVKYAPAEFDRDVLRANAGGAMETSLVPSL